MRPRWGSPIHPMVGFPKMTLPPAHYSKTQRRLLTGLGGLGVLVLAAATFVLSYDDLRTLAIRGGAVRHRAFLYPGMIDGLVVVVILAILAARRARWASRAVRWLLLLALVAGAGAAGVQRAVKGYATLPHAWVSGGVAAAPWVILVIAVWLWLSMIKQVLSLRARRERPSPTPAPAPAALVDKAIIPGLSDHEPEETMPLPRPTSVRELEPVRTAHPGPEPVTAPAAQLGPAEPEPATAPESPRDPAKTEPVTALAARSHPAEPEPAGAPAPGADAAGPEPEPMVEAPMNDEPAEPADEPAPRLVARTSLPTDVMLVGAPRPKPNLTDTQPDGIKLPDTLPDTLPDGIPIVGTAEDDVDAYADERAEDPDAGEAATDRGSWGEEAARQPGQWPGRAAANAGGHSVPEPGAEQVESTPPSSKFRSSPTPPRD